MPILTRYLTPADYGITAIFNILVSFISPFIGLCIPYAIQRQYYELDKRELSKYISNCIVILLFSSIIVSVFFILFSEQVSKVSLFPNKWLWTIIVVSMGQFIIQIVSTLWITQIKPMAYGLFLISQTAVNAGLSIFLIVGLGKGWDGRIEAQIISVMGFALIGMFILFKGNWIKFSLNFSYFKHAIKIGLPLIPYTLGSVITVMTDRFLISKMVGLEATGLYTVGAQIGMIIGLLQNSFAQAYVPKLFEVLKRNIDNEKQKIVQFSYIYFLGLIILALTVSILAPWFLSFFVGKGFRGASVFIFWIAIGYAFDGMGKTINNCLLFAQKTNIIATITIFSAGLNVVLNYFFIKNQGAIGAAQATAITLLLTFLVTWILSNQVMPMPWFKFLQK